MRKSNKSIDKSSEILKHDEQNDCRENKKEKPKSKTKGLFKRIFTYKGNFPKKSKSAGENSPTKAMAHSTMNMFNDIQDCVKEQITPERCAQIHLSNSVGDLSKKDLDKSNWILESNILYSDIYKIDIQTAPTASIESLETTLSSDRSSGRIMRIPQIFEEPASEGNDPLPLFFNGMRTDLLTIPTEGRSRKSSDNDSAVDMKFNDDISDQGEKTMNSETDSSRCTSSSCMVLEEANVKQSNIPKTESKSTVIKRNDSSTSWRKIKVALIWTPFIQQYARHRYPWIQIAGHQGNFKPGEQGTILKKHTGRESICLQMMCEDNLADFVPSFKGDVDYEGERYICMEDLLSQFNMPSLMDIKMGTRTYLEEELIKAKINPKPRQDMYEKMIEVAKDEPTEEEHKLRAVIKPRYMQWRETLSSTLTLGFRIEGIKKTGNSNDKYVGTQSRNYKRTRYREEVKEALLDFIDNNIDLPNKFIKRINCLRNNLENSSFFWDHEFIGSSLLFVHDKSGKANIWMIDFGKTIPLPPKCKVDHISPWIEGNHEDGYLFGLDKLVILLEEIHSEISHNSN